MVETHHTTHINLVPSVCWIWMDGTIPNPPCWQALNGLQEVDSLIVEAASENQKKPLRIECVVFRL